MNFTQLNLLFLKCKPQFVTINSAWSAALSEERKCKQEANVSSLHPPPQKNKQKSSALK